MGDCEFREVFVSGAPVLRELWTEGPGATLDVWEGRYFTWSGDPDEVLKLHVEITSDRPIRAATLWESGRVLARYQPGTKEFRTTYINPSDRSSRGFSVTVDEL